MSDKEPDSKSELSVKDLTVWLEEETIQVAKAMDLRIRELTQTVVGLAAGEIDQEQARAQIDQYREKWSEALPEFYNDHELSTRREVRDYLDKETADLTQAANLRLRELSNIVISYAAGEINASQAQERFHEHYDKWGEALPGVNITDGSSDRDILSTVKRVTDHAASVRRQRLTKREDESPGISR